MFSILFRNTINLKYHNLQLKVLSIEYNDHIFTQIMLQNTL